MGKERRTARGSKAYKVSAACGAPVLVGAECNAEIRQEAGVVVFAGPGGEIGSKAPRALRIKEFRNKQHARGKPVLALTASERIAAEQGSSSFHKPLETRAADIGASASFAPEGERVHV
ncbi:MAG: hypothetical protein WAM39_11560 [Bryobacteraceae bacterium]